MKQKMCVRSMFLGAGIMAVGITIGQFIAPNIEAQSNGVFDEIQCTELTVMDKNGKSAIRLGSYDEGNCVFIYDKRGKVGAILCAGDQGTSVSIYDKYQKRGIGLDTVETGNSVVVYDKRGKEAIGLDAVRTGNWVSVYDRQGNIRWQAP